MNQRKIDNKPKDKDRQGHKKTDTWTETHRSSPKS